MNRTTPALFETDSFDGTSVRLAYADQGKNFVLGDSEAEVISRNGPPTGKLLFLPSRGAFRAGSVNTAAWNAAYVGTYSFAVGCNTIASGEGSVAAGYGAQAHGNYAVALGLDTQATGMFATAMGAFNQATGVGSFVAGANNAATGEYASAFGRGTAASFPATFAVGQYNTLPVAGPSNLPADRPALVVGIGRSPQHRADGFTVFQDGTVGLADLKEAPQQTAGRLYRLNGKLHYGPYALGENSNPSIQSGQEASATGNGAVAIGKQVKAFNDSAIALGSGCLAGTPDWDYNYDNVIQENIPLEKIEDVRYLNGHAGLHVFLNSVRDSPEFAEIGSHSFAAGYQSVATQQGAIALGKQCVAGFDIKYWLENEIDRLIALGRRDQIRYTEYQYYQEMILGEIATLLRSGQYTLAAGFQSRASQEGAIALGIHCIAGVGSNGKYTLATGYHSKAVQDGAVALGVECVAGVAGQPFDGTVEGNSAATYSNERRLSVTGRYTLAAGYQSKAYQNGAVALGISCQAGSINPKDATGILDKKIGLGAFAAGYETRALGAGAVALGLNTQALGYASLALGHQTKATADYAVAMGEQTSATAYAAIAMGFLTEATANNAVALGEHAKAIAPFSVAAGVLTTASGAHSLAFGHMSTASNYASVAFGHECEASGEGAFAVGLNAKSTGKGAVALGQHTQALGNHSLAAGLKTCASNAGETALGQYNVKGIPGRVFSIGIGDNDEYRRETLQVFKDGSVRINSANVLMPEGNKSPVLRSIKQAQLEITTSNERDGITLWSSSRGHNALNIVKSEWDESRFISFGCNTGGEYNDYREMGAVIAKGNDQVIFATTSDARLKNASGEVTDALSVVVRIKIRRFSWKSDERADVGVFAQELYEVYPQAVEKGDDSPEVQKRWMVDYSKLQPLTIAAIQELEQTVTKQQQQIDQLHQQVTALLAHLQK